ncbi:MAG: MotA/TolQ/ExbB proton channel family protein [Sphingobacteriales bacterium]|jgi:biopolymer transport protein ExbB|nr:MotA/TolQ/ExbB proton channel family protein [Sphingobacteriales bacterium]
MLAILLQLGTTTLSSASTGTESMFSILVKGGVLMIPLAMFMAISVFFFFERLIAIRKASRIDANFMNIIRDHILTGNVTAARSLAKNTPNPVAKMIDKGIQRIGKPIDAIEKNMDNVGKLEIYKMEKNLSVLSVVARIAPLFGFVGTIIGLVMLLREFAAASNPSITDIADAMYVKMITSATGLIIGIVSFLGYSYLNTQIDKTVNKMETASADFIDILQEPTR